MSDWKPKRFWKQAHAIACDDGYTVHLDGRPVRTPAKAALVVPTQAMAVAIAQEWDAQTGLVDPRTMPVTRGANAAIDKLRTQRAEVIALLAEYGGSDLLCYRATDPEGLVQRQTEAWDPLLRWADDTLDVRLRVVQGVMHVKQDSAALDRMNAELDRFDDFALAAVHDLISLSGSLILALAVTRDAIHPQEAWLKSRIDEHWQAQQWGQDEEATAAELIKRAAFLDAERFYRLANP